MYTFLDAALVRAAALPPSVSFTPWPDLTGCTDDHLVQWRDWLRRIRASEEIMAAIELASPSLAARARSVCEGRRLPKRQVRRTVVSIVRYLLRATTRATPFGLFAGVAPARFGPELSIAFNNQHHAIARVDTEWLAEIISRLETNPELRRRLPVVLNNLAFFRGERLVVGCQRQAGALSRMAPAEVSVRRTTAVDIVAQAACSPIPFGDLVDKVITDFPSTPTSVIERMLAELVTQQILVTSLRPPMTTTDPLAHVVGELAEAGADDIAPAADLAHHLRAIQLDLSQHNLASSPTEARDHRTAAAKNMQTIAPSERPVTVDLLLDGKLILPQTVAREAEAVADVLARLTPHPNGGPAWRHYHGKFLERYGSGAVVPVLEVTGDLGLGFPAGYRDAQLTPPPPAGVTERDEVLMALAQKAAIDRTDEVVLDEEMLGRLAAGAITTVQPHTELRFRLHAQTADALKRGEFELVVVGASRTTGATAGRFLDLLDREDYERMVRAYTQLPTVNEDAIPVQVSGPPLYSRAENIARSPAILPHSVHLAEHQTSRAGEPTSLEDLAVAGDAERLYLMSISRRRPVEPMVFSALEFTQAAHPLLRFLCEISTARAAPCAPFSWGAASRMPFLPRIRYGRTILSAARWILPAADLPGSTDPWPEWSRRLAAWCRRHRVPASVYLSEDDRLLRLNLDEPAHQYLLRTDLNRAGHVTLREAPENGAFGWCDGRAHEIVIPLAATRQPEQPRGRQRIPTTQAIGPGHGHLPGNSEWLYLKLYGHPDRQTTILTTHLPALLSTWDSPPEWWFIRYRDPEPHLRLRFRLPNADAFGETACRIGDWTASLRRFRLVGQTQLDTYYPETGRFGDGGEMTTAESLFVADSAAALTQLTHAGRPGLHQHALIAASLVDMVTSFAAGFADGMHWLIEHVGRTPLAASSRGVHDLAVRLADPGHHWAALRAIPGGEQIATAWGHRRTALATYRDALVSAGETSPEMVLPDLVHLHVVRMIGLSSDNERTCTHLARAAALSWVARHQGKP